MAAASVQATNVGFSAASVPKAFASNVIAGHFLVAVVVCNTTTLTVTDNLNGAWTKIIAAGAAATLGVQSLWIKPNALAGATTVTFGSTGSAGEAEIMEYSGVTGTTANATGTFYDAAGGTTSYTLATSVGTVGAGDLIIAGAGDGNAATTATMSTSTSGYAVESHSATVEPEYCFHNLSAAGGATSLAIVGSLNESWPSVIASFSTGVTLPVTYQLEFVS